MMSRARTVGQMLAHPTIMREKMPCKAFGFSHYVALAHPINLSRLSRAIGADYKNTHPSFQQRYGFITCRPSHSQRVAASVPTAVIES